MLCAVAVLCCRCGGNRSRAPDGGNPAVDLAGANPGAPPLGQLFPAGSPWYTDVSNAPLDGESSTVIAGLQQAGGWGNGNRFQIDFSLVVLAGDASTPFMPFNKTGDFYDPDCDFQPMPVPAGGVLEGETGYSCTGGGDCHLLVVHAPTQKLYEMWRADITSGVFNGGCLAVWDLTRVYPPSGRGDQCTSADAAGYPIAPLLVSADEVAAGEVKHALRFILPNSRIRHGVYLHPSTHSTNATSGGPALPPYGAHFRLSQGFDMTTLPNDAARTVARALQRYGMFLADGGNIPLTFASDRFTKAKWADLQLDAHALFAIQVGDFEMVDGGTRINYTGDCARNP
jgi:serine/threonine-protein kinase